MEATLQDQRPPLPNNIMHGVDHLAVGFGVCGALSMALVVARSLPWPCFPVIGPLMTLLVNMMYLGIYALAHHDIIDDERRERLVQSVQGWCPVVVNLFAPSLPAVQPPAHVLATMARSVAQLVGA